MWFWCFHERRWAHVILLCHLVSCSWVQSNIQSRWSQQHLDLSRLCPPTMGTMDRRTFQDGSIWGASKCIRLASKSSSSHTLSVTSYESPGSSPKDPMAGAWLGHPWNVAIREFLHGVSEFWDIMFQWTRQKVSSPLEVTQCHFHCAISAKVVSNPSRFKRKGFLLVRGLFAAMF